MHSLKCTKSCECKVMHQQKDAHICQLRLQLSTKYRFVSKPISLINLHVLVISIDLQYIFLLAIIKKTNSLLCFRSITTSIFITSLLFNIHKSYNQPMNRYIYKAVPPRPQLFQSENAKIYSLEHVNTHNFSWLSPILHSSKK